MSPTVFGQKLFGHKKPGLLPSLFQAIVHVDGDALVMRPGEQPLVVASWGQVKVVIPELTLDSVNEVAQLLPQEVQDALDELGAARYDFPRDDKFPHDQFTLSVTREDDEGWAEIRRRRLADHEDFVPEEVFETTEPLPAREFGSSVEHVVAAQRAEPAPLGDEALALPQAPTFWPGARPHVAAGRDEGVSPELTAHDVLEPPQVDRAAAITPPISEAAPPASEMQDAAIARAARAAVSATVPGAVGAAARLAVTEAVPGAVAEAARAAVAEVVIGAVSEAARAAVTEAVPEGVAEAARQVVSDRAPTAVDEAARNAVAELVAGAVGEAVRTAVTDAVADAVAEASRTAVTQAVPGAVAEAVRSAVTAAVPAAIAEAVPAITAEAARHAVALAAPGAVAGAAPGAVAEAARAAVAAAVPGAVDEAARAAVVGAVSGAVSEAARAAVAEAAPKAVAEAARAAVAEAARRNVSEATPAALTEAMRTSLADAVPAAVEAAARATVAAAVPDAVAAAVRAAVADAVPQVVDEAVGVTVAGAVPAAVADAARAAVAEAVPAAVAAAVRTAVADAAAAIKTEMPAPSAVPRSGDQPSRPVAREAYPAPPRSAQPPWPYDAVPPTTAPTTPQTRPPMMPPITRSPIHAEPSQPPPAVDTPSDLERLLRVAAARGASTLYLSANARPSVRVDGQVRVIDSEPVYTASDVISLLTTSMPDGRQDVRETGATTEWISDIEGIGRVRCTSFTDHGNPAGAFRMMPVGAVSVDQLGLAREIQSLALAPDGLILVTGPRASGKRTLISALVDLINRTSQRHVITIEREITIVHVQKYTVISQREVRGNDEDVAAAARAALREDPDVLVLEQIRTGGLMTVALEAAASGHLVIGGFSAHSVTESIDRIIDRYMPEYTPRQAQLALADNLRAVVAQVLLAKAGGGRVPAREILLKTDAVGRLIAEGKTSQLPMAIEAGRPHGMKPLSDALIAYVQNGIVDVREAYRHVTDRPAFIALLKRQGIDTSAIGIPH